MRIRIYDQSNVLISNKEIKCDVPKYVREFDNNRPLVRVSNEEHKLLNSKTESIEKLILIEKFRQILQYDYSLYLHSEQGHSLNDLLRGNAFGMSFPNEPALPLDIKGIIRDKEDLLDFLLDRVEDLADERYCHPGIMHMWFAYIKSESKCSWTSFLKNIPYEDYWKYSDDDLEESGDELEQVSWRCAKRYRILLDTLRNEVYPQLKRKSVQSIRLKSILSLIPTSYSSQLKPYSFDDDKFVVKLCNALYETNCKRRSDVYGILTTYNFLTKMIVSPANYAFLIASTEDYSLSINEKGEHRIEVFMSSEENANVRTSNRHSKAVAVTKAALKEIYDEFCSKYAKDIEKDTKGDFITYLDGISIEEAKTKHWRDLYSKLRKDISLKKDLLGRSQPMSFFYSLILRHDNKNNNVIENDDFIKDILIVNDRFSSVIITDVLGCIYQFNYIKSKAYPVKSKLSENNTESADPFVWECNCNKKYTLEESIERALLFIAPILNSNFIVKDKKTGELITEPNQFKEDFRNLFKMTDAAEKVRRTLLHMTEEYTDKDDRYPYQGFNYKLLFNIIGMLKSYHDKNTQRDVQRIFIKVSKHLADKLMKDRKAIEKDGGWSAFRKYIAYYKSYVEANSKESYSIVDKETIKYVQKHFHVAEDTFEKEEKGKI